jgi:hypothetical protein
MMTLKQIFENIMQPLALGSFGNWLSLLTQNRVDEPFILRAVLVSVASLATILLRVFEWVC